MDKLINTFRDFEVKNDDVYVIGFPRSGTTWTQELVWLIANDLDYDGAKVFTDERIPNLDCEAFVDGYYSNDLYTPECYANSVKFIENMKSPRFIKTHLSPKILPRQLINGEKKPKIVYVARNVKDVCLSMYYYSINLVKSTNVSLDEFCRTFAQDVDPLGSYWESVLHFWNLRHQDNVLFIRYEEMISNLSDVIHRVADFFGKSITMEQEDKLIKWLDFETFKKNPAINHENVYHRNGFIRKGKVGESKKEMSSEILSLFDNWINESTKNSDYVN